MEWRPFYARPNYEKKKNAEVSDQSCFSFVYFIRSLKLQLNLFLFRYSISGTGDFPTRVAVAVAVVTSQRRIAVAEIHEILRRGENLRRTFSFLGFRQQQFWSFAAASTRTLGEAGSSFHTGAAHTVPKKMIARSYPRENVHRRKCKEEVTFLFFLETFAYRAPVARSFSALCHFYFFLKCVVRFSGREYKNIKSGIFRETDLFVLSIKK